MRINDVLRGKDSHDVISISPDATVRELVSLLARHNIGAVVVCGEDDSLAGIVSERDVVRRLNEDDSVLAAPVSRIMTTAVHTCEGNDAVDELMQVMTQHRVRHVPVMTEGRISGLISIGDVVKSRIGELEFERDQLDSYVHQT